MERQRTRGVYINIFPPSNFFARFALLEMGPRLLGSGSTGAIEAIGAMAVDSMICAAPSGCQRPAIAPSRAPP
eukprot:7885077-Pyramimonas_sp.AAC.1